MSEIKFIAHVTIPCNVKAEPGWNMLVLHDRKVKLVDVVGWQIEPRFVDVGGMFGFGGSTIVLGCNPAMSSEFANSELLKQIFDPSKSKEEIEETTERMRKIYERGQ